MTVLERRRPSRGVASLAASPTAVLAVQVLPAPAWPADYTVVDQASSLAFLTGTGSSAGWSRTPVTVSRVCLPSPGAILATGCPVDDVVADRTVLGLTQTRTIIDALGATASVSTLVGVD